MLPKLGSFRAAVAQLAVSALAGAAILSEAVGVRLLLSEALAAARAAVER